MKMLFHKNCGKHIPASVVLTILKVTTIRKTVRQGILCIYDDAQLVACMNTLSCNFEGTSVPKPCKASLCTATASSNMFILYHETNVITIL